MNNSQAVAALLQYPGATLGLTTKRIKEGLTWRLCSDNPFQFSSRGPRGGIHYLGIATHTGRTTISYGPKGSRR